MDLKAIEALLAISTTGTVAAAARDLNVSRSSVRRRLDALEAELGVILVHRGDNGARLTAAGRLLAARGEALVRSAREAANDARAAGKRPDGVVRFIGPLGPPPDIRAQVTTALTQLHSSLQFDFIETEDPLAHLDDEFDLLVYFGKPLDDGAFFMRSVARLQLGLMASPAYLEAHGTPQTVEDLAEHKLLLWRSSRDIPEALPGPDGALYPIKPTLVSANLEFLRELAWQGGGITWGVLAPLGERDTERALVPVMPDVFSATLGAWLICPLPSTMDPRIKVVLEAILTVLEHADLG
ncbi:MAG: LysR family transcriptional regulator [Bradymonadia bacterium]